MLAVIKTGGKQYLVAPGQKINIDPPATLRVARRTGKTEGQEVVFDQVLLLEKNKKVEIGSPTLKGAKVLAKVLKQGKEDKLIIFKYKPKKRYQQKKGHRQPYTQVEIVAIEN